jgi:hypothetical protein
MQSACYLVNVSALSTYVMLRRLSRLTSSVPSVVLVNPSLQASCPRPTSTNPSTYYRSTTHNGAGHCETLQYCQNSSCATEASPFAAAKRGTRRLPLHARRTQARSTNTCHHRSLSVSGQAARTPVQPNPPQSSLSLALDVSQYGR